MHTQLAQFNNFVFTVVASKKYTTFSFLNCHLKGISHYIELNLGSGMM